MEIFNSHGIGGSMANHCTPIASIVTNTIKLNSQVTLKYVNKLKNKFLITFCSNLSGEGQEIIT